MGSWSGKTKPQRWIQAIALTAALFSVGSLGADTLFMKNGQKIEGLILSESDSTILIQTRAGEMKIDRARVERIEKTGGGAFALEQYQRAFREAEESARAGRKDEARRQIDRANARLAELLGSTAPTPEVVAAQAEMEKLRTSLIPREGPALEAERLAQEAAALEDKIDYSAALKLLQQASTLDPSRADLAFRTGRLAQRLNDLPTAFQSFRKTLELDAESYYAQFSAPLVEVTERRGRQLLADRRPEEALPLFEFLLVIKADKASAPVSLADFQARISANEAKPRDQVLMEVFRYADTNDLVDLAFVSISEVRRLKPDDPEVRQVAERTEFFRDFRGLLEKGNVEAAGELVARAPKELREDPGITERLDRLAAGKMLEVQAAALATSVREAFEAGDFAGTIEAGREYVRKYSKSADMAEVTRLLRQAELEAPLRSLFFRAESLVQEGKDDAAEGEIEKARGMDGFAASVQRPRFEALAARIPRERRADDLWRLATAELDREAEERVLELLTELVNSYGDTRSGKRANEWLRDHRERLERQARRYRPVQSDFFLSVMDPALWAAAADPARPNRSRGVAIPDDSRREVTRLFDQITERDAVRDAALRPSVLLVVLPIVLGLGVLFGIFWMFARPGSGEDVTPEDEAGDANADSGLGALPGDSHREAGHAKDCTMCGLQVPPKSLACPHCGANVAGSDVDAARESVEAKGLAVDPWEIRTAPETNNKYPELFAKARDLADSSDVQAAIVKVREALAEDPRQLEGYRLLASLYERAGQRQEAATCYREILLIDPTETVVRQKIEASLAPPPLNVGRLPEVLAALIWWTVFWTAYGLDPQAILVRLLLCLAGAGLTAVLLRQFQKRATMQVPAAVRPKPEVVRPIPQVALTWAEQAKQAKRLATNLGDHLGIEVPALTPGRFLAATVASFVWLLVCVAASYYVHAPWAMFAWPTGTVLLFYAIEIHPRLVLAQLLIRHFFEETLSPWADPHKPFMASDKVRGEFRMQFASDLPYRWALDPIPYDNTRQGVLNSLQQVLNRHWKFHDYYTASRVVREYDVPVPAGGRVARNAAFAGFAVIAMGAAGLWFQDSRREMQFVENMRIGFTTLVSGEGGAAIPYFLRAHQAKPHRAAPALYLAHSAAQLSMPSMADRWFLEAARKPDNLAVVFNDYANFLVAQGRIPEAIERFRSALSIDSENADIRSNLGSALYRLARHEEAIRELERAVAINPKHSRAHTTMGLCWEALKREKEALAAFTKAIEVAPDVAYTKHARDRIEAAKYRGQELKLASLPPAAERPPAAAAREGS